MLNVTLVGKSELVARLDAMPAAVVAALQVQVMKLVFKLQRHVQEDKLTGQVLHVVTGNLRRSITTRMETSTDSVWGYVFSSGDVKYAAIHEYGGVQNRVGSKKGAYQVTVPARPYMRPSLADMAADIQRGMADAVVRAIKAEVEGGGSQPL